MRARKVDANQAEIVAAMRKAGVLVLDLSGVGEGCPDLLCAKAGKLLLLEIKDGKKPPSKQALTPDQVNFHAIWGKYIKVCNSVESALQAIEC